MTNLPASVRPTIKSPPSELKQMLVTLSFSWGGRNSNKTWHEFKSINLATPSWLRAPTILKTKTDIEKI